MRPTKQGRIASPTTFGHTELEKREIFLHQLHFVVAVIGLKTQSLSEVPCLDCLSTIAGFLITTGKGLLPKAKLSTSTGSNDLTQQFELSS